MNERNPNAVDVDEFADEHGLEAGEFRRIVIRWNRLCDRYGTEDDKRVLSR